MSLNRVHLIGHLAKDVELRYTPSGQAVADIRIATNESFTNKQGQKVNRATFHSVVVWGKQAENCAQYLSKGREVYVEGRLSNRSWDDKEGKKRYVTEIVAQTVQFLGGGRKREETAPAAADIADVPAEEHVSEAEIGF